MFLLVAIIFKLFKSDTINKNYITVTFLLFIPFGSNAQNAEKIITPTVLSILPGKSLKTVHIEALDSSLFTEENAELLFYIENELGIGSDLIIRHGVTEFEIDKPTFIYDTHFFGNPYLIFPGDSLVFTMDSNWAVNIHSIINEKVRDNELNFYSGLVNRFGPLVLSERMSGVNSMDSLKKIETKIFSLKQSKLNYLDSFFTNSIISKDFYDVVKSSLNNYSLRDSLILYWTNKNIFDSQAAYLNMLNKIGNRIIKDISDSSYFYFENCELLAILQSDLLPDFQIKTFHDFQRIYNIISKSYKKDLRDYLLARTIAKANLRGIFISKKYFQFNGKDVFSSDLISEKTSISEYWSDSIKNKSRNNNLLSLNGHVIKNIKKIIKKNRGKIILIDLWASWCKPCRSEIPILKEYQKVFQNQSIVFISISLDKNIGKWDFASKLEGLPPWNSFIFLKPGKDRFEKKYKTQTIPRYIIFKKNGKILNADAPPPSSPKLKELINEYLSL